MEDLDRLIEEAFESLKTKTPGTKEYNEVIDSLTRLSKLKQEKERSEFDIELEERKISLEERKVENEEVNFERKRQDDEKKNKKELVLKIVGVGVEVTSIVVPLVAYGKWYHEGLKFEETGAVTSTFLRNLLGRIRPK